MEVVVVIVSSLVAGVCAWLASRHTYCTEESSQMTDFASSANTDRSLETSRFSKMFLERRFTVFFLSVVLLGTGLTAHFMYTHTGNYFDLVKIVLVYIAGLTAMIFDIKYHTIPNLIPVVLLAARAVLVGFEFLFRKDVALSQLISSALGLSVCFVFLFIISKATHNGMGMGDVKLLSSIGFMCGLYAVCSILLMGLLASCIISILLLVFKVKTVKDYIPFAPFIYIGIICTILLGTF